MPNKPAAAKALRQSRQRALRHRALARDLKAALKRARRHEVVVGEAAQQLLRQTVKLIDKAVRQNILKKNAAARTKSRLMKLWGKRAQSTTAR
jgi:small subunit ribosomal protein S20